VKPRLLDLFCGAGGAARGYHRAGFDVTGVDIRPQPNYPFTFWQADAFEILDEGYKGYFAAIHASPPCQGYSNANNRWSAEHPRLIAAIRERIPGVPYVIENVEGARAELLDPVMICGLSLGLNTRRHRLFECSFPVMVPPCAGHYGDWLSVYGTGNPRRRQIGSERGSGTFAEAQRAMGIDWMTRAEMSEAIPPAYTEHIGAYLMAELTARAAG
jgi:DNA (cytosine-5)-methyltransferase 1